MGRACPALLVSAPASGQGKTTVAAALARLHARRGRVVRAFKCGADFNDPIWLERASRHAVHNIDLWLTGQDDAQRRLHEAAGAADLIVIEGAMGLFDGTPSAADLACRFGVPVLAVIDASAMVGTFGALAFGLRHYRSGLPWAGVLANRVAGEAHAAMLQAAVAQAGSDAGWLGAIAHSPACEIPERHLGLVPEPELADPDARLDAAADLLETLPIGRVDLQRFAVRFAAPATPQRPAQPLAGRTIAIAKDEAFCFIYAANLQVLQDLGARIAFFSPLRNEPVPACDAVWLPGGYPELHAPALAAASTSASSLRRLVQAGAVVWAECGGMMALCETLADPQGIVHPMWGLLPGQVRMHPRVMALGPQQLKLAAGTLRGHSFHYSSLEHAQGAAAHTEAPEPAGRREPVFERGTVRGSYFHAWFASDPAAAATLFQPPSPWPRRA